MIPRAFHFIWLGSPLPAWAKANIDKWESMHPGWTVLLWDDHAVLKLKGFIHGNPLHLPSKAMASDILRLEILFKFGGVYLDCDMECQQPIDPIIESLDRGDDDLAFVGWEQNGKCINNAIIGAPAGHRSIYAALANLGAHLKDPATDTKDAARATGPHYLSAIWFHDSNVKKFPRSFFYPYDWHEPWRANEKFHGAYAIHRWNASWIGETIAEQAPYAGTGIHFYMEKETASLWVHAAADEAMRQQSMSPVMTGIANPRRIIYIPLNHIPDRRLIECHHNLPANAIGIGMHRTFSSLAEFELRGHFPFLAYAAHGVRSHAPAKPFTGTADDFMEVVSIPTPHSGFIDREELRAIIEEKNELEGCPIVPVWGALSTKLVPHPVNKLLTQSDSIE